MVKTSLCDAWGNSLAEWAIPEEIVQRTARSPWALRPEKFAPTSSRTLTPTVGKVAELLVAVEDPNPRSLIDVGCGAGGVSLLLLAMIDSLIVVDESKAMLEALKANLDASINKEITFRAIEGRWPDVAPDAGNAQVIVCANVLYNVPRPCEFIEALNNAAKSAVVIELHEQHPHSVANDAWKYFWNIDRPRGPSGFDLFQIVEAMGYSPQTDTFYRDSPGSRPLDDDLIESIAQRICLDKTREIELRKFLEGNPIQRQQFRMIWWEK